MPSNDPVSVQPTAFPQSSGPTECTPLKDFAPYICLVLRREIREIPLILIFRPLVGPAVFILQLLHLVPVCVLDKIAGTLIRAFEFPQLEIAILQVILSIRGKDCDLTLWQPGDAAEHNGRESLSAEPAL
jgi:hypothetical protein